MKIGLYGGAFNPIHNGHLICARNLAEKIELDKIILIPAISPPHKENLADPSVRLKMCQLAIDGEPLFEVSDIEFSLSKPTYTINTVDAFLKLYPNDELCWIIGFDTIMQLHTWHRIGELIQKIKIVTMSARYSFIPESLTFLSTDILQKLNKFVAIDRITIRATDIRNRLRNGKSIKYLVPDNVNNYILQNGIYDK